MPSCRRQNTNHSLVARPRLNLSHSVVRVGQSQRPRLRAASPRSVVVAAALLALLALLALASPPRCAARSSRGLKVHLPPIGAGWSKGGNKGGGNKGGGNNGGGNKGGGNNGGGNKGGGNSGGGNKGGNKGIGLQPVSCYFATKACDFVFSGSASLVPLLPLFAMRADQPLSGPILHKKGNRPVVSAAIQSCRAVTTLNLRLPSCPAFSLLSPSAASTGVRLAGKPLSLIQVAQYSGACFTLDFGQMAVKMGSGPRGITRLVRGDGNTEFPENRRCIVFRSL
ncbi:hypothetical protein CLOM_g15245 [Closterium sp. NIES-68]|nr:hypothetical protein CLOM_g15245 [Closterium sp. NIES-68]GJP73616.1 hypothetical protein CLOP_g4305 [Closterium sp. NIES-67]